MNRTIGVCTFNLHGKQKNDGMRLPRIVSELAELGPDLCALQEVVSYGGKNTAERLVESLEDITGENYATYFVRSHRFYGKYPEGVAILSKHPFKDTGKIDLNNIPIPPLLPRYAAISRVEIHGRPLLFASVHLDHHNNPMVREAQVKRLFEGMERFYSDYHTVILAGDFNDTEGSPAIEFLKKRGFIDAYRFLNDDPGYTFPVEEPKARIDYIMVKGNVEVVSARRIMKEKGLSDHLGVYAVLRVMK